MEEITIENVRDVLNLPLMKVKVLFVVHFLFSFCVLISAGQTYLVLPYLFYTTVFLGFLLWATETSQKIKILSYAQIFNFIGIAVEIALICCNPYGHGYNRTMNVIFLVLSLCMRPLNAIIFYNEAIRYLKAVGRLPASNVEILTGLGNYNENLISVSNGMNVTPPKPVEESTNLNSNEQTTYQSI